MLLTTNCVCSVASLLLLLGVLLPQATLPFSNALPITSKPIESTAENLAWQAWLMLPPEQKSLEKSRKVTPKSIFTLPFRECPPGHQLYEQRCIPTVNIDQNALLTQQLLNFVIGDASADSNLAFDYEDEEVLMYEPPQKLSGDVGVGKDAAAAVTDTAAGANNYDDAAQLPSQDEPLKFNIFQQKFPTDYEAADSASMEGSGSSAAAFGRPDEQRNSSVAAFGDTKFMEAFRDFLAAQTNATSVAGKQVDGNSTDSSNDSRHNNSDNNNNTGSGEHALTDLQSDGSHISANVMSSAAGSEHIFAFSDIAAIVLPAVATQAAASTSTTASADLETQQPQRISLFKDDSAVQLVTGLMPSEVTQQSQQMQQQQQQDISQLLKVDALLPLHNVTAEALNNATSPEDTEDSSTGMPATYDEAVESSTMLSDLSELLAAAEQKRQREPEKEERTRSVTERQANEAEDAEAPAELSFTTTEEPVGTTNMQLDETTIIETRDSPALLALQELQQQQVQQQQQVVLKKSKVEPVEWLTASVPAEAAITAAVAEEIATTTAVAAKATATVSSALTTSTPLPTETTASHTEAASVAATDVTSDRFYRPPQLNVAASAALEQSNQPRMQLNVNKQPVDVAADRRSELMNTISSSSSSGSISSGGNPSEINIEQELRMINELVKGRRQQQQQQRATTAQTRSSATMSTKAAAATTKTTATTESSLAAVTAETQEITEAKSQSKSASEIAMKGAVIIKDTTTTETTTKTSTKIPTTVAAVASLNKAFTTSAKIVADAATTVAAAANTNTTPQSEGSATTTTVAATDSSTTATDTTINNAAAVVGDTTEATGASAVWPKIMPILVAGRSTTNAAKVTKQTMASATTTNKQLPTTVAVPKIIVKNATSTRKPTEAVTLDTTVNTAATTTTETGELSSTTTPASFSIASSSTTTITDASSSSQHFRSRSRNRSHRNSKISRIQGFSTNSLVDDSSTSATTRYLPSLRAHVAAATTTTATTTAKPELSTTTTTAPVNAEPFWWLPAGWSLGAQTDIQPKLAPSPEPPTADDEYDAAAQSLLLRFWSAFPGNQAKVKE